MNTKTLRMGSTFLAAVVALFAFGLAQADVPDAIEGTTLITAEELIDLVESTPDLVIIDARAPADREKGYIEGSVGLPDTDTNEVSLAKHLASKDTPVIFYCNGVKCGRSVTSAKLAVSLGYSKIYWFKGGWGEWTEKGLPITK